MAKAPIDIRSLARSHTELAIQTLAGIARNSDSDPARVGAAIALLDRGWGKPTTTHSLQGEGDIKVTIRHIVQGRDTPTIDAKPVQLVTSPDLDGAA